MYGNINGLFVINYAMSLSHGGNNITITPSLNRNTDNQLVTKREYVK